MFGILLRMRSDFSIALFFKIRNESGEAPHPAKRYLLVPYRRCSSALWFTYLMREFVFNKIPFSRRCLTTPDTAFSTSFICSILSMVKSNLSVTSLTNERLSVMRIFFLRETDFWSLIFLFPIIFLFLFPKSSPQRSLSSWQFGLPRCAFMSFVDLNFLPQWGTGQSIDATVLQDSLWAFSNWRFLV